MPRPDATPDDEARARNARERLLCHAGECWPNDTTRFLKSADWFLKLMDHYVAQELADLRREMQK